MDKNPTRSLSHFLIRKEIVHLESNSQDDLREVRDTYTPIQPSSVKGAHQMRYVEGDGLIPPINRDENLHFPQQSNATKATRTPQDLPQPRADRFVVSRDKKLEFPANFLPNFRMVIHGVVEGR